jgi:hypothetical protein
LGNKDEGDGSDGENQSPFLTGMKEMEGMGRTKGIPVKLCSCVGKQG